VYYCDEEQAKIASCLKGILRGVFQNHNPLCGRNPMRTDLD